MRAVGRRGGRARRGDPRGAEAARAPDARGVRRRWRRRRRRLHVGLLGDRCGGRGRGGADRGAGTADRAARARAELARVSSTSRPAAARSPPASRSGRRSSRARSPSSRRAGASRGCSPSGPGSRHRSLERRLHRERGGRPDRRGRSRCSRATGRPARSRSSSRASATGRSSSRAFARSARRARRRSCSRRARPRPRRGRLRRTPARLRAPTTSSTRCWRATAPARVRGLDDLIDAAAAIDRPGPARSRAVGIVSTSGGAGVVATEAAERAGLELPLPGEEPARRSQAVDARLRLAREPGGHERHVRRRTARSSAARSPRSSTAATSTRRARADRPPAGAGARPGATRRRTSRARPVPLAVLWVAGAMSDPRASCSAARACSSSRTPTAACARWPRARPRASRCTSRSRPGSRLPASLAAAAGAGASSSTRPWRRSPSRASQSRRRASARRPRTLAPLRRRSAARSRSRRRRGTCRTKARWAASFSASRARMRPPPPSSAWSAAARAAGATLEGAVVQRARAGRRRAIVGVRRDPVFGPVLVVGLGGAAVEALGGVARRPLPLVPGDAAELPRSCARRRCSTASTSAPSRRRSSAWRGSRSRSATGSTRSRSTR